MFKLKFQDKNRVFKSRFVSCGFCWGKKNSRGTRVFQTRVLPFYFSSSSLSLFLFCILLHHSIQRSSPAKLPSWCSSSSFHPVFFSNQIAYPGSFRLQIFYGFFSSSQIFFFFWGFFFFFPGFFLLFLGWYVFCSLFELDY